MSRRRRGPAGFTLVELMVAVGIIAILAATAIPRFMNYLYRARTSEVSINLRRMHDGFATFYMTEHAADDGSYLPRQFPVGIGYTPLTGGVKACCQNAGGKCMPTASWWNAQGTEYPTTNKTWVQLNFSLEEPHYYMYTAYRDGTMTGLNINDRFILGAQGDLNCNGVPSVFTRIAFVSAERNIQSSGGVYSANEFE